MQALTRRTLLVQKYGGTSLGTPERIKFVAGLIAKQYQEGRLPVVVVSAMGDTTDHLISQAKEIAPFPPEREMDMLLSVGERISMALLTMALSSLKIRAVSLTGSQTGIVTTSHHTRAKIQKVLASRVHEAIRQGVIPIIAGFQGVSAEKEITTLGRGGSDTSAVALAISLNCTQCEIYTDVDGVFLADPRLVSNLKPFATLPSDLMLEMASAGAGVLHPRSVSLAKKFGLSICVLNTFRGMKDNMIESNVSSEGTLIVERSQLESLESYRVTGVQFDERRWACHIELSRPGALQSWLEVIKSAALFPFALHVQGTHLRFFIDESQHQEWKSCLEKLSNDGFVLRFEIDSEHSALAVVGDGFSQDLSLLADTMDILNRNNVSVSAAHSSAQSVIFTIPMNRGAEATQILCQHFQRLTS